MSEQAPMPEQAPQPRTLSAEEAAQLMAMDLKAEELARTNPDVVMDEVMALREKAFELSNAPEEVDASFAFEVGGETYGGRINQLGAGALAAASEPISYLFPSPNQVFSERKSFSGRRRSHSYVAECWSFCSRKRLVWGWKGDMKWVQ